MRSLLTLSPLSGNFHTGAENSSVKVRQHLKRGLFFCVRTLEKYGAFSVISGREWANRIPCKGEYARRSQTVFDSRPFLRPAKGHHEKICEVPMLRFFLSSRCLRLRYRLLPLITTLSGRTAVTVALGALLMLPAVYLWEVL